MTVVTCDSISLRGAGTVSIAQHQKGARFTQDSLLLADFCRIGPRDRILEPGAGTGVVSILLAKKFPGTAVVAVETQATMSQLCRENIVSNGLAGHIDLINEDFRNLRTVLRPTMFDVIVANPPYVKCGTGRQSTHQERLVSRYDRLGTLQSWLDLQMFLRHRGRYYLIFPGNRTGELFGEMRTRHLEPKRMRPVYARAQSSATLVLVEAVKSGGSGLEILPPLVVHGSDGGHTDEMRLIYSVS